MYGIPVTLSRIEVLQLLRLTLLRRVMQTASMVWLRFEPTTFEIRFKANTLNISITVLKVGKYNIHGSKAYKIYLTLPLDLI